jgi:hypothetical protein
VVSGSAMPADVRRALDAGADLFLPKPCLPSEFVHHVKIAIAVSRQVRLRASAEVGPSAASCARPDDILDRSNRLHAAIQRALQLYGRSAFAPLDQCPFCGLQTDTGPHGSDAECIVALRAETERIRGFRVRPT